jgi:hypothetical protein
VSAVHATATTDGCGSSPAREVAERLSYTTKPHAKTRSRAVAQGVREGMI